MENLLSSSMGVILKVAYLGLFKTFPKQQVLTVYFDEFSVFMPVTPLEGPWRETARRAKKNFVQLNYSQILECIVRPASGTPIRPRPPYYKIILKDNPLPLHFQRRQFYGKEKMFLEKLSEKGTKISLEDQLHDQ